MPTETAETDNTPTIIETTITGNVTIESGKTYTVLVKNNNNDYLTFHQNCTAIPTITTDERYFAIVPDSMGQDFLKSFKAFYKLQNFADFFK